MLAIFIVSALVSGALLLPNGQAEAAKTIHVGDSNNNSLDDTQSACIDSGGIITSWHFVINQIDPTVDKPDVTVEFDTDGDGDVDTTEVVSPGSEGGARTAHYTVAGSGVVIDAYASIDQNNWSGQFVLSDVTCVTAPPLNPCTPFEDRIIIQFNEFLGDPSLTGVLVEESDPVSVTIPIGTYNVTLQSTDNHSEKPEQIQEFEQWFASFTAGGTVNTGTIDDLPENLDIFNQSVGTVTFTSEATEVVARHALIGGTYPNFESVFATCLALDPV
jgi:hypothetical protein